MAQLAEPTLTEEPTQAIQPLDPFEPNFAAQAAEALIVSEAVDRHVIE